LAVNKLTGIAQISGNYDAFLMDAWGVLHDGKTLYPGALSCLEKLHQANKRVILMSNSSRRASILAKEMLPFNIPEGCLEAIETSGELCWQKMRQSAFGKTCYFVGPEYSKSLFEDTEIGQTTEIEKADFLLVAGMNNKADHPSQYEGLLGKARERDLQLVCANSDIQVIHSGERRHCGGAIVARYEKLGGKVHHFGKPHNPIYKASLARLSGVKPSRILAVGDSFDSDIPGAINAGIDCLFVIGGIHEEELGGAPVSENQLDDFYDMHGLRPTAAIDSLVW